MKKYLIEPQSQTTEQSVKQQNTKFETKHIFSSTSQAAKLKAANGC